jgi:hypothetical protein
MCSVQPLPGIVLMLCWSAMVLKPHSQPHRHQYIFQELCRNFSRKLRYRWAVCLSSSRQGPTDSKERSLIRKLPKSIKKCGSYWHKSFTPLSTIWIPLNSFSRNSQFVSGNQRTSVNLRFPKSFLKYENFEFKFLSIFSTASICTKVSIPPQWR